MLRADVVKCVAGRGKTCTPRAGAADNPGMPGPHTIILTSGGLRSLVAMGLTLAEEPRPRMTALFVQDGTPSAARRFEAVRRQCDRYKARDLVESELAGPHGAALDAEARESQRPPLVRSQLLLAAMAHAVQVEAQRIVWPIQQDADVDRAAEVTEMIVLVQGLAQLEFGLDKLPRVDTPMLELTNKQMIELGGQLEVPFELAWSCLLHQPRACRVCVACRRRKQAFDAAGIVDPAEELAGAV